MYDKFLQLVFSAMFSIWGQIGPGEKQEIWRKDWCRAFKRKQIWILSDKELLAVKKGDIKGSVWFHAEGDVKEKV